MHRSRSIDIHPRNVNHGHGQGDVDHFVRYIKHIFISLIIYNVSSSSRARAIDVRAAISISIALINIMSTS